MGIVQETEEKDEFEEREKKYFLNRFNLNCAGARFPNVRIPGIIEITVKIASGETIVSNYLTCNLPGALGYFSTPVISFARKSKLFKKTTFFESLQRISCLFKTRAIGFCRVVTFSFSSPKGRYPQSWKTIFVHLKEKSNLLVRSDNNTGVSLGKLLQTTTI